LISQLLYQDLVALFHVVLSAAVDIRLNLSWKEISFYPPEKQNVIPIYDISENFSGT
jgi:hypothetical protein